MKKLLSGILLLSLLVSCSSTKWIEPLKSGEREFQLGLGGHTVDIEPAPLPIPYFSLAVANGITDKLTSISSIHITSLLVNNIHGEFGALYAIHSYDSLKRKVPGISMSFMNHVATNFDDGFRYWPQVDFTAFWKMNEEKLLLYGGLSNYFEVLDRSTDGPRQQSQWLVSPNLGLRYHAIKQNSTLGIEIKAPAPVINYDPDSFGLIENPPALNRFGIYFTFTKPF